MSNCAHPLDASTPGRERRVYGLHGVTVSPVAVRPAALSKAVPALCVAWCVAVSRVAVSRVAGSAHAAPGLIFIVRLYIED